MNGEISKALQTENGEGLSDATKHSQIAHIQAQKYLSIKDRIGKKNYLEMNLSDRADAEILKKIAKWLMVEENKGNI